MKRFSELLLLVNSVRSPRSFGVPDDWTKINLMFLLIVATLVGMVIILVLTIEYFIFINVLVKEDHLLQNSAFKISEYACVGCRHLSAGAKHVISSRGPCAVTLLSCFCHDGVLFELILGYPGIRGDTRVPGYAYRINSRVPGTRVSEN